MPASKRLAAHRLAAADRGDDELEPKDPLNPDDADDESEQPEKPERKDDDMAEANQNAAIDAAKAEARAEGMKAATDRLIAVKAHENFEGREAAAFDLLADEDLASMSAEAIGRLLGKMPKAETTALTEEEQREAAEAGGRAEMQAALAAGQNSNINANDEGGKPDVRAKSDAVWAKARARVDKKEVK